MDHKPFFKQTLRDRTKNYAEKEVVIYIMLVQDALYNYINNWPQLLIFCLSFLIDLDDFNPLYSVSLELVLWIWHLLVLCQIQEIEIQCL